MVSTVEEEEVSDQSRQC